MVVLPLPDSPAMVVKVGLSASIDSEKSSQAMVSVLAPPKSWPPLRKTLRIWRASRSGGMLVLLVQQARRQLVLGNRHELRLVGLAALHCQGAARVE